ncbi:ABC transporter substrate-binding protein [Bacillus pseudomycoides]|uniref:ABC transporter substrate-binding protein n=1 Tax=Bacillus pseudomycoides TaxID=64104 RepID=A0AA91VBU2_9BACI|nr:MULTISPECIES: ABC transporter substrate-binding protein [Bacillus]PEB50426.1 ABC transporter substrate-binding protein [Bacillus sp. AFS098217]PED81768.1 ABC transporter substrate-binding protein [Bacillus pseudomycoides]PEU10390.1 ABC transporter substrate-binding protein [Bacillus sp. AFS019443]PEU18461.1 ABC transporter substrate-binding protein [Bacillus sp. AFS014408]PFW64077.1 ABC transporter substrate-binding protein [Bacillus sp. AFS075034]
MRKIAFFFFLLVIGGAMSSCSRDTPSIKYSENGLPILKDRHLVAYVAAREEVGEALLSSFCKPRGCTYEFIRLSTEEILRRVEAEAGNPKADIIIGGTLDAHQTMKQKDLSIPVTSQHTNSLSKAVKDKDGFWYGYEVDQLAIAINKERWNEEIAPLGLSYPTGWKDLLHPAYAGKIVMPDPNVSGTAYTLFQSLIDTFGEEEAKGYVRSLAKQVAEVTVNGYMPAEYVASGEYMIGINFMGDQRMLQKQGFPILSKVPEQTGLSVNAISKLKHAPSGIIADLFIDYCLSEEAGHILEKVSFGVPTMLAKNQKEIEGQPVRRTNKNISDSGVIEIWNRQRLSQK